RQPGPRRDAAVVVAHVVRHAEGTRQPGARRQRVRHHRRFRGPGHLLQPQVPAQGGHQPPDGDGGQLLQERTQGRHPARGRRQQPRRDGVRLQGG
ncbi:hypothetical protein BN1708_020358, partial [Verticillium longisporum]